MPHSRPSSRTLRGGLAALCLAWGGMCGGALAQDLTIGVANPVASVDPHISNTTSNFALTAHLFDALVRRDAALQLQPGLAESWRPISDTVWEFRLRRDVAWHDGQPFTAEDVAATFARVPTIPTGGGYSYAVRPIRRVEVVDAHTLRLHLDRPNPLLPNDLASVQIIARHAVEGPLPDQFNTGRAAIGTGPYRFAGFRPGQGAQFTRNEAYWGDAEPWARVDYRFLPNDGARSAAILAGDVDVIDQVPSNDLARLKREPRLRVSETPGVRVIYLQPDFSRQGPVPGVTDHQGRPLERNPFLDRRVRRALDLAIDRQALASRVMEGSAIPTAQWLPEGTYSHNPELRVVPADPAAARRLLAEAGFPEGFRLVLSTPNDRYPGDARTAQAVAQFWTRIGVRTEVEALPWASYLARGPKQEFGFRLGGWGSSTGEASSLLRNVVGTYDREKGWGSPNFSRYSNPELDALTERALTTQDDAAREAILREAVALEARELGILPLFLLQNAWTTRQGLTYAARADEQTLATAVRPAP
ncbi:ABC transporter substrate-binding protein [Pseudoroseomonas cervicalis]|uniref:ABC transporter substrate-binding protein n=1 Tax=Teichococcus cervicalis TaxID=204525 RepID=UPI002785649B|nr:ABC transporter substrate-binding protein [Pseudoroseomonas cervicalis]MDQ1081696.1 peptide/nickel transport system substrate-binding protein [Pseudoroseomonas cervicalis]